MCCQVKCCESIKQLKQGDHIRINGFEILGYIVAYTFDDKGSLGYSCVNLRTGDSFTEVKPSLSSLQQFLENYGFEYIN